MACTIFLSTSGGDHEWTDDLRNAIAKHCRIPVDEIYWYRGEFGHDVDIAIEENAQNASILLCLVTDRYATSPRCLREHRWFCKRNDPSRFVVPVLVPGLGEWPDFHDAADVERFVRVKRERLGSAIDRQFPGRSTELSEYADKWLHWLTSTHAPDLRDCKNVRAATNPRTAKSTDDIQMLLKRLERDIVDAKEVEEREKRDPEKRALRTAAYLSAYALAADRYWDGGWGFSTADEFSFDDDGDELVRGRYDLNVVILRALEVFLRQPEVEFEWERALGEGSVRPPLRKVKDRLPLVARYLACLEGGNNFDRLILTKVSDIAAELSADPPNERWGLEPLGAAEEPCEHHIVLYEFALRSRLLAGKDKVFGDALDNLGVDVQSITRKVAKLEGFVTQWLSTHNIFWNFLEAPDPAKRIKPQDRQSARKARILPAVLWCLLAGSTKGLYLMSTELSRTDELNRWDREDFGAFQNALASAVERAIRNPAAAGDTLLFTVIFAYVLHSVAKRGDWHGADVQFNKLRAILNGALRSPVAAQLILRMNSLGWAVLILLADDMLDTGDDDLGLDRTFLASMWNKGRELREGRVRALTGGLVADLKAGRLQNVVAEQINDLLAQKISDRLVIADDDAERIRRAEDLRTGILQSTFWGVTPSFDTNGRDEPSSCLSGLLQVRSTGTIDIENDGYDRLFLYPFSALTDMNVYNLMSVRREIGEQDTTLVEKMGAVVVEECFQREGDRFVSSGKDGFKNRTDAISEKLKDKDWPTHLGFDDLLKLREGKEGFRWVYRTAFIQPEHGARSGASNSDHVIAWHFVEVPPRAALLIEEDVAPVNVVRSNEPTPIRRSATA